MSISIGFMVTLLGCNAEVVRVWIGQLNRGWPTDAQSVYSQIAATASLPVALARKYKRLAHNLMDDADEVFNATPTVAGHTLSLRTNENESVLCRNKIDNMFGNRLPQSTECVAERHHLVGLSL